MANIPGTNVPAVTFGPNGFQTPSGPDVLTGVQADISAAFGRSLNFNLNTPQGQLSSSISALVVNTNSLLQFYTQQVDPAFSVGRMQDAIARINFLTRIPAQATTLQVSCSGLSGTVIPAGSRLQDPALNLYISTVNATIPAGGSVTVAFAAVIPGPTPIPSTVVIYQALPGWDSATVSSGVVGSNTESATQFEARRQQSVAANSIGSLPSIAGAVLSVSGVTDVFTSENPTGGTITVLGVSLAAHSVYVCVNGGADLAVGTAIWSKKAPGAAYNGNTTVTVQDTSQPNIPFPSYSVTFQRPAPLPIIFAVNVVASPQVPSNATTLIQNAIINAFNGGDGGQRAKIGTLILATRFNAPVAALGSWAAIRTILIGSALSASASFTASISGTNMTVTAVASGTLAANQNIVDSTALVQPGTTIVSQTSGPAGGTGVYVVSLSQTVASEAMFGVLANQGSIQVQANQAPTIFAANIAVTVS